MNIPKHIFQIGWIQANKDKLKWAVCKKAYDGMGIGLTLFLRPFKFYIFLPPQPNGVVSYQVVDEAILTQKSQIPLLLGHESFDEYLVEISPVKVNGMELKYLL